MNSLENKTDKYEVIEFFITAIDLGILTKDDLYDYVLERIEKEDVPDPLFCEIALELSKDWKLLRAVLLGILHRDGFVYGFEKRVGKAYRWLTECVGRRYESGCITLKETVNLFYKFSLEFEDFLDDDCFFMFNSLDDDYDLAEQGVWGTLEEVDKQVREILEENRKNLDTEIIGGIEKWLRL